MKVGVSYCLFYCNSGFLEAFVIHEKCLLMQLQVRHGCDIDMWSAGPGGCHQTLLHRSIDENKEDVACFLIRR
jgi:hypothetical protein